MNNSNFENFNLEQEDQNYVTGSFKNPVEESVVELRPDRISESFIRKYRKYSKKVNEEKEEKIISERNSQSITQNKFSHSANISPFISAKNDSEVLKLCENHSNQSNQSNQSPFNLSIKNPKYFSSESINSFRSENNFSLTACEINKQNSVKNSVFNPDSRFSLPRRKKANKKIFEEFLVIGIENSGLEYITDLDELLLTPKIIYNYPNELSENELKL